MANAPEGFAESFDNVSLADLVKTMAALREQHDALKREAAEVWAKHEVLSLQLIPERMDEEQLTNFRVEGVGAVKLLDQLSVRQLDKEAVQSWLIEHDLSDLITDTVNASTLAAEIRQRIKRGDDIPDDDMIAINAYTKASITK